MSSAEKMQNNISKDLASDPYHGVSAMEIYEEITPFLMSKQSIYYVYHRDMMEPVWDNAQATAYVQFDPTSFKNIRFGMNKSFMTKLNYNEKAFVFAHEALHILFNHGKRGEDFYNSLPRDRRSKQILNIAMDWCINEILATEYFQDYLFDLEVLKECATIENFENKFNVSIERGKDFKYYYNYYVDYIKANPSQFKLVPCGEGEDGIIIDDLDETMFGDAIFDSETSKAEREFQEKAHKHNHNKTETDKKQSSNSYSTGGVPPQTIVTTVYKKMNLTDAINRYIIDRRRSAIDYNSSPKVRYKWWGVDKRNIYVQRPDLSLLTRQVTYKDKKTRLLIYCDVSGSVESYTEKFINIVNEIDQTKCEIIFKVWADTVSDVFYNKNGVAKWKNCGGGTNIENVIQDYRTKHLMAEAKNPVDKIVVLTDGHYSDIYSKKKLMKNPEDWVFFMVDGANEKNVFNKSTSVIIDW